MKARVLIFLVWILVGNSADAQTYSTVIPDDRIYRFLTAVQTSPSDTDSQKSSRILSQAIIPWDSLQFAHTSTYGRQTEFENYFEDYMYLFKGDAEYLFTPADRAYFATQVAAVKDTLWRRSFGKLLVVDIENPAARPSKAFSVPIFTADGRTAIVRQSYLGPPTGGYGGVYVFVKETEDRWRLLRVLNRWAR